MIRAYDVDIPATAVQRCCQKVYETSIDKESRVVITVVPMVVATEFHIRIWAV